MLDPMSVFQSVISSLDTIYGINQLTRGGALLKLELIVRIFPQEGFLCAPFAELRDSSESLSTTGGNGIRE